MGMQNFNWGTMGPGGTGAFGPGGVAGAAEGLAGDIDWVAQRTPTQDWNQFTMGLAPSMQRIPLEQMRNQLQTRYALAMPYMAGTPSFGGFMAGGPAGFADQAGLRARAQLASDIGGLSRDDYGERLMQAGGPETDAGRAIAAYGGMFNPLQGGDIGNQRSIANLLASQRAGGGTYQGAMGSAIQRAMNAMYSAREAAGYDPNSFLNWYMNMTAPAAT